MSSTPATCPLAVYWNGVTKSPCSKVPLLQTIYVPYPLSRWLQDILWGMTKDTLFGPEALAFEATDDGDDKGNNVKEELADRPYGFMAQKNWHRNNVKSLLL